MAHLLIHIYNYKFSSLRRCLALRVKSSVFVVYKIPYRRARAWPSGCIVFDHAHCLVKYWWVGLKETPHCPLTHQTKTILPQRLWRGKRSLTKI